LSVLQRKEQETVKKISLVVPCYCEEEALPIFYREAVRVVEEQLSAYEIEFILVDDGSSDGTLAVMKTLAGKDPRVKYVSFSRNFGKEAGIYAGLQQSGGDYVAILDADLQDPPSLLPQMLACIEQEGYDCAATRRVTRKGEPPIRSFFARRFYRLIRHISKTEIVDGARDFRLMTRQMTDAVLSLCEYNRFSKGIFGWVGFKTKWFEYENVERAAGETKWSFWKLFLYSLEGIAAFSTTPLALSSVIGLIFCLIAFVLILVTIIRQLTWGGSAYGWSSLVCIILLVSGVQLFCVGILGQYLAKTYLETKHRPIYLIRETNCEKTEAKEERR